jgi:hypothetical protein
MGDVNDGVSICCYVQRSERYHLSPEPYHNHNIDSECVDRIMYLYKRHSCYILHVYMTVSFSIALVLSRVSDFIFLPLRLSISLPLLSFFYPCDFRRQMNRCHYCLFSLHIL